MSECEQSAGVVCDKQAHSSSFLLVRECPFAATRATYVFEQLASTEEIHNSPSEENRVTGGI